MSTYSSLHAIEEREKNKSEHLFHKRMDAEDVEHRRRLRTCYRDCSAVDQEFKKLSNCTMKKWRNEMWT